MGPTDFTTSLPFAKTARGRIAVDDGLHVLVHPHRDHSPKSPAEVHPVLNEFQQIYYRQAHCFASLAITIC